MIDPSADCLPIPGDRLRYEVGVWAPSNRARKRLARIILERERKKPIERRRPGKIKWAEHALEGWRPVFQVIDRMPDQRDVREFRRRDYVYRRRFEEELDRLEREPDRRDTEAQTAIAAHARDFAVSEYPYIMRERRHVAFHGWARRFGSSETKE